jgi:hypothetical protein
VLRAVGFFLGIASVAMALVAWRVPPGDGTLGTDITFFSVENGNLAVSPAGTFAQKRGLEAGDALFEMEANAGTTVLYQGRLAGLRHWTKRSFVVAPRARQDVHLRATLPQDAGGRFATLNLELRQVSR